LVASGNQTAYLHNQGHRIVVIIVASARRRRGTRFRAILGTAGAPAPPVTIGAAAVPHFRWCARRFAATLNGTCPHWPRAKSHRPQAQREQADDGDSKNGVSALHSIYSICRVRHFCPQSSLNLTQNPAGDASSANKSSAGRALRLAVKRFAISLASAHRSLWERLSQLPRRSVCVRPKGLPFSRFSTQRIVAVHSGFDESASPAQGEAVGDSMHNSGTTVACCRLLTRQRTDFFQS
jgi:hypothetical protein